MSQQVEEEEQEPDEHEREGMDVDKDALAFIKAKKKVADVHRAKKNNH